MLFDWKNCNKIYERRKVRIFTKQKKGVKVRDKYNKIKITAKEERKKDPKTKEENYKGKI